MDKKNPLTLAVEALGLDFVRGSENPEDYPETFKTLIAIGDLKKSMNSKLSSLGMGFLDMNDGYILNDLQYVAEDTLDPEVFELFMDSRPLNAEALRVLVEGE